MQATEDAKQAGLIDAQVGQPEPFPVMFELRLRWAEGGNEICIKFPVYNQGIRVNCAQGCVGGGSRHVSSFACSVSRSKQKRTTQRCSPLKEFDVVSSYSINPRSRARSMALTCLSTLNFP